MYDSIIQSSVIHFCKGGHSFVIKRGRPCILPAQETFNAKYAERILVWRVAMCKLNDILTEQVENNRPRAAGAL